MQTDNRTSPDELADMISRFVNRGGNGAELVAAMLNDHPTLQQRVMTNLILPYIRGMAAKPYVDARNEASRDLARTIVAAVGEDVYLPFV